LAKWVPLFPKSFLHNRWWRLEKKLRAEVFLVENHGERERDGGIQVRERKRGGSSRER